MKLNAKRTSLLSIAFLLVLISTSWAGYRLFIAKYQGWLIEDVANTAVFVAQLQQQINELTELQHPSIIHVLPSTCPCTMLTIAHAQALTVKAGQIGTAVYQAGSQFSGLGQGIPAMQTPISPLIIFTQFDGQIAYAGAYSDGLRCTAANSLVDQFIDFPEQLPRFSVVGLDVNVCRCK